MANTSTTFNLDEGFDSPVTRRPNQWCALPCECLPLRTLSVVLSLFVPQKRCSGLTQGGLSQVWQTNNPSGNEKVPSGNAPLVKVHATRCARRNRLFRVTFPYPSLSFPFIQIQHRSPFTTFFQNLRCLSSVIVKIMGDSQMGFHICQ